MKTLGAGILLLIATAAAAEVTTEVFDEIYVIHDPDLSFLNSSRTELDYKKIWFRYRNRIADFYDEALIFVDQSDCTPPAPGPCKFPLVNASHKIIYNQTRGIGNNLFDYRSEWAPIGEGRIKGIIEIPTRSMTAEKLLHEMGHQWLAHVNYRDVADGPTQHFLHSESLAGPGEEASHWGSGVDFETPSVMDGLDWVDNDDGSYSINWHFGEEYPRGYSSLDLYLMGLIPPAEVRNFRILVNHGFVLSDDPNRPTSFHPERIVDMNINKILYQEKDRDPDYLHSQRVFHVATIVVTPNATIDPELVSKVDAMRKEFTKLFRDKTGGRAVVDTSLLYVRHKDLYIPGDKVVQINPFMRTTISGIWVRNHNDYRESVVDGVTRYAGNENQEPALNKNNYLYVRVSNRNPLSYRNVTVNCYSATRPSTLLGDSDFVYPVDWQPGALIGSDTIDVVPGNGSAVAAMPLPGSMLPGAPRGTDFTILCEFMPLPQAPSGLHHARDDNALGKKHIHFSR